MELVDELKVNGRWVAKYPVRSEEAKAMPEMGSR